MKSYWLPGTIGVAFLAVALLGVITYQNTVAIRLGERRIINSYAIREATHQLLSAVKDMETGQRGYLLTGDEAYLAPYHTGIQRIDQDFERLRTMTVGNATQQSHLDRLKVLVAEKQRELAEAIDVRRQEPHTPVSEKIMALISSERSRNTMDQARQKVDDILADVELQLTQHEAHSEALAAISRTSVTAGNVIALALIFAVAVIAFFDRNRRDAAERNLQAKQAELTAIVDSARDGIVTFNDDLRIRLMNPAAAALYGSGPKDMSGRKILDFFPERLRQSAHRKLYEFLSADTKSREFSEETALRSDGSEFPMAGIYTKSQIDGHRMNILMFRDLTDEKASRAKKQQLSAVLRQIRDAIIVCDLEGRIVSWNDGARLMYDKAEAAVLGRSAREVLFPDQAAEWDEGQANMLSHGVHTEEIQLSRIDGRERIVEHRRSLIRDELGEPVAQLIFNIDISERKRREVIERRSQRLESIGTLAGGVAHDLNNVLTPILMSAKLVKRGSAKSERLLDAIVLSAERGGRMIKKLLAFAEGEKSSQQLVNLGAIISEAEEILSHTLPKTIKLRVTAAADLAPVLGDATELSQVLMNLAINARDAMPVGGSLSIEVSNVNVDAEFAERAGNIKPGPHVLLVVADTGEGISKDIIDRIFDPFFTTKPQGKGTGLGLATTLGIVRSYGGEVTVYSEPGMGATFSIYLPASRVEGETAGNGDFDAEAAQSHGETILVVDDESLIVETARETLEFAGYQVLTAASGEEALTTYQSHFDRIDLVLLDMMMPGMDGLEVKSELRLINPDLRIVASSGLRRPGAEKDKLSDINGFLPKPYSDEQLLKSIRNALDATPLKDEFANETFSN